MDRELVINVLREWVEALRDGSLTIVTDNNLSDLERRLDLIDHGIWHNDNVEGG